MKGYSEIYAVDFDGTLNLAEKYPALGEPNKALFTFLKERQQAGDKIILYTCREKELLEATVKYCRTQGLEFDAVNDNLKENIDRWGNNCRKIFADYYIDDRNMDLRCITVKTAFEKQIMRFSKEKFRKNAPAAVKRQLKGHIDIIDGLEVIFEGEYGQIPRYFINEQEYYLYPVYKSWCV